MFGNEILLHNQLAAYFLHFVPKEDKFFRKRSTKIQGI